MVEVADAEGCTIASPLGNAKRCINLEFRAGGEGTFFWSEFSSTLDAPMTYNIEDDAVEYCLAGSCSGLFSFVGDKLESAGDLRLDQDCKAIYVLRRK